MAFSSRKAKKFIFGFLLLSLALLIYVKHRQIEKRGILHWYDRALVLVTAPIHRGVFYLKDQVVSTFRRYIFLVGVEEENESLKEEVEEIRREIILLEGLEVENKDLCESIQLKERLEGEWVVARVISYPPMGLYRQVIIDKGNESGIERRAPVVSKEGLVGQVSRVFRNYSQVLLITDPTSSVDGRVEGMEARGLVVGQVMKLGLDRDFFISAFEYLTLAREVEEGNLVVTSGLDGIFPTGIRIGSVRRKKKNKYDVFQQVDILPSVDFNKLKSVIIQKKSQ